MAWYGDIALYGRDGRLMAMVEVKSKAGTTREWAAQLRRNIFAHGKDFHVDFFLIVTPDKLYLWRNVDTGSDAVEPDYEIDLKAILRPYFERAGLTPEAVGGYVFELVVASWLGDLIRLTEQEERPGGELSWLVETGLADAVKGGRMEYEAAP